MAINQVTAANTFSHWLGATQQLINKYNAFETELDNVANTANNVLVIKNDTENVYSNTVNVYNAANNVYQDIIDYTSTAYDIANSAIDLAETAYDNANVAYNLSIDAQNIAEDANSVAVIAYNTSQEANTVATDILNNIDDFANNAVNTFITPIFTVYNENDISDTYYPIFTKKTSSTLDRITVSSGKFSYIPATGSLTANTFNATTDIKFNGSVIANSSGWVGTTIPIAKGGTGATTDSEARTNLGLAIGTNVQEYSAKLTDIAALSVTNNNFIVANGSSWTSKSAADSRTALGLVIGTNVQAYTSTLNTIAGLSATANNFIVGNGSTWESKTSSASRTALGLNLGTDAYKLVQTVSGGGLTTVDRGTDGYYLKQSSTGFTWDVGPGSLNATSPLVISGGTISLNQNFAGSSSVGGAANSVTNALSFSTAGGGHIDSYNGSASKTISYNSVGAPSVTGTNATGTWGINISGNAATVDKANYANKLTVDATADNATHYFVISSSGESSTSESLYKTTPTYGLSCNPRTGALTTKTITCENIYPSTTNTYDLGGAALRFRTIYATNINVNAVANNLIPSANNTYALGSSDNRYTNLYTQGINCYGNFWFYGTNIRPGTGGTENLGLSSARWGHIYTTNITSNNAIFVDSDERLKTNIKPSNLGLDFIMNLNPVSYTLINGSNEYKVINGEEVLISIPGKRPHYGFIAQEVKEVMGDNDFGGYGYDPENDIHALRYGEFIAPLTKAIQEQQEIIKSLQLRIETLEKSANVSL